MLEFWGEFGRVRLGGGPQGSGVYWVDDAGSWNKFDPLLPSNASNQDFDSRLRDRKIAFGLMGMVRIKIDTRFKKIEIRWNVRTVHPLTIDTITTFLEDFCCQYTTRICFYIDAWHSEIYKHVTTAIDRIQGTKHFRNVKLIDRFFLKTLGLRSDVNRTQLIDKCVHIYEKTGGDLGDPDFRELMPYLLVYKPDEKEDQMIIANAGHRSANAKVYGAAWAKLANGSKYDSDTPGAYYSMRASAAYSDVMGRDEPRMDQIRAIMQRPDDEPIWSSYQRFLFRGSLEDGTPALICLSDLNEGIDIPFLVS